MLRSSVPSCSHLLLGCVVPALLLCTMPVRAMAADVPPACTPIVARIVSMQGVVEMRRAGRQDWAPVMRLDTPVCQGDVVHAGPRSRAALVILPEKFVRLDQNSTVSIAIEGEETVVEFFQDETTPRDACGAGYFITRFPRKFKVRTPFVNAAVEGTEFLVSMSCTATSVAVFEGKVSAETLLANAQRFILSSGETISAGPGEPPAIKVLVKPVDAVQWALYYPPLSEPGPGVGPDQQCDQSAPDERSRCLMVRAEQRLRVGRVDEAQDDIDASLKLVPDNSDADALLSVIDVAKNDKQRALTLAQHATQLSPVNPRAWIALSYAQQASFKLEDALTSAERAAELAPRSSIALTRVAELMMSLGKLRSADRAARAALDANPNDSRAHTILGFIHLAEVDTKKAHTDFEAAIARDSSDPLPRLGLGLAIIREGNLTTGREQIEIAVALDPTNSLIRSYVGKAYYEENTPARDKLAATQFGLAKQLDPKDPTPWFYDAILKETQNRSVEALEDLQKSIQLNDNRAVYRSRFLLDQDQASREASLAQVYQDVGFPQLSLSEAYRSVNTDPGNSSAHQFLSDAYGTLPRHELAQVSELLQAQLRQPLTLNPTPPQRSEPNLFIPRSSGPLTPGLHEFNPLFVGQGAAILLDGLVGELGTLGGQTTIGLLGDKAYASAGLFHYETEGFRTNNDFNRTIANAFFQVSPSYGLSAQMELRTSGFESGDLPLRFDPTNVQQTRHNEDQDSLRLGARYVVNPDFDLLFSGIYQKATNSASVPPFGSVVDNLESFLLEAQGLVRLGRTSLIVGAGGLDGTLNETFAGFTNPEEKQTQNNAYMYASIGVDSVLRSIELGVAVDRFDEPAIQRSEVNPKLGLILTPLRGMTLRAAYLKTLSLILPTGQTIEPTQVAGFNQLFDDPQGTESILAGLGIDQQLSRRLFLGAEFSRRQLTVPVVDFFSGTSRDVNWNERMGRGYVYWAPDPRVALSAELYYEHYERPFADPGEEQIVDQATWRIPLGASVFLGPAWSVKASWTYWYQSGTFISSAGTTFQGKSTFPVTDFQVTYRLPYRKGFILVGANNLFNAQHNFQEVDLPTPRYIPQRFAYVRVSLSF